MSIKGQDHSLTLAIGHSDFKIKFYFSQKLYGHLKPNFIGKPMGAQETNDLVHMTKLATMLIFY